MSKGGAGLHWFCHFTHVAPRDVMPTQTPAGGAGPRARFQRPRRAKRSSAVRRVRGAHRSLGLLQVPSLLRP
jgi:hypothetical protein